MTTACMNQKSSKKKGALIWKHNVYYVIIVILRLTPISFRSVSQLSVDEPPHDSARREGSESTYSTVYGSARNEWTLIGAFWTRHKQSTQYAGLQMSCCNSQLYAVL